MTPPAQKAATTPWRSERQPELLWFERTEPAWEPEVMPWWKNRFEIGTRMTSYSLKDTSRPMDNRFLGSINELKEDQDYAPYKFFANVWLLKWLGAGISYEKVSAMTWTVEPGEESYSDGTFVMDGPIFSALAAWPNRTRFTPFAELGWMAMSGSFEEDPAWANAHGRLNYQRFEIVEKKGGDVWGFGCAIQLYRQVELDFIFRRLKASVVVDHILLGNIQHNDREFPMDSDWYGMGLKYRF